MFFSLEKFYKRNIKRPLVSLSSDINTEGVEKHSRSKRNTRYARVPKLAFPRVFRTPIVFISEDRDTRAVRKNACGLTCFSTAIMLLGILASKM
ncbi:hypothetical protein AC249_AIPGENE16445 [Exaiptasia diaphana]|nr:hypothetical protein AC249_AIPGENE16445 [Exaiptasia diaphana]